jgi:1-acyl-sn-glycerol-3-phosphate acyltransferase
VYFMLLVRSQFANLIMYLLIAVFGIFGLPIAMWSRSGTFLVIKAYCRTMFWIFRVVCGLDTEIRGEIPQGEVLVCSKHMSFMDILLLAYALPRVKFVMKRELRWAPVIGIFAWRMGCPAVDRSGKGAAIEKMVAELEADKEIGQTVIFPQGTRVLPGAGVRYKTGAGVVYTRMNKTCVPVATNAGVFWARRSPVRKPGTAIIEFLEPIPPGMELLEFMEKLEDVVETNSNRLMNEAGYKLDQ